MRKVYVFKNLGTGQVKNVLAEDGEGRTALDNALADIGTELQRLGPCGCDVGLGYTCLA